jgi:hypothetical protein
VPGWRDSNDGCELREARPGVLPDRRRTGLYVAYVAMPPAWPTTGPASARRRDMGERVATWAGIRAVAQTVKTLGCPAVSRRPS